VIARNGSSATLDVAGCRARIGSVDVIASKRLVRRDADLVDHRRLRRPIGGALVAVATLGEASPTLEVIVGLLGGTIAAGSHFTKASTRVAANASPEPFSNWALSFFEDAFVLGLGVLALMFPIAAFVITVAIVVAIVFAFRWIVRKLRNVGRRPMATA
jgi:hypothetical protein